MDGALLLSVGRKTRIINAKPLVVWNTVSYIVSSGLSITMKWGDEVYNSCKIEGVHDNIGYTYQMKLFECSA